MSEHNCGKCGSSFNSRYLLKSHENFIHNKPDKSDMERLLWGDYEYVVYRIRIEHPDSGEKFWYVGKARDMKSRYRQHISDKFNKVSMPNSMGIVDTHADYNVLYVDKVEIVDELHVDNRERKLSYQTAIEKETTKVLGGK